MIDRGAHIIYKAMYDEQTHELQKAQPFCGSRSEAGFNDDIGAAARFRDPAQGCFDEEDNFYLCDQGNYCIRKITPNGTVTTFAGRPGDWGYADGDLEKRHNLIVHSLSHMILQQKLSMSETKIICVSALY